jgi:CRISPR-associated protein Cmr3
VSVLGPLLVRLPRASELGVELFVSAPADCVWFGETGATIGRRLAARLATDIVAGAITDLDAPEDAPERVAVVLADFLPPAPRTKPAQGPAFWPWSALLEWLADPRDEIPFSAVGGVDPFPRELRTHVTIDPETGTAEDGALYATEGLRLTTSTLQPRLVASAADANRSIDRFALLGAWSGPSQLSRSVVTLGGERQMAFLEPLAADALRGLEPPGWLASIRPGTRARVILLTPAIFGDGAVPFELAGARVVAAKVDRPEVVSGWDFETNRPKPTRRMAPAGSVYWVDVPNDSWARNLWLSSVSHDEQDRRDGFGTAVVGAA